MGLYASFIDRVANAVGVRIFNARVSGDANDRVYIDSGGLIRTSDGTDNLATISNSKIFSRRPVGGYAATFAGRSGDGVNNVVEMDDYLGAPIAAVGEAGAALFGNDHIYSIYGLFYPKAMDLTIYGSMLLSGNALYMHVGPPGNMLPFIDATGEVFDGSRAQSMGGWTTLVNCTGAVSSSFSGASSPANPTGLRTSLLFTASSAATMSWAVPAASAYTITGAARVDACISVRAAVTPRSKFLSLVWYNAAGGTISTTDGTAVTDTTTGWTFLTCSGLPPSAAVKYGLKVTVTSPANAEQHYHVAAGGWQGLVPGDLTTWSPPFVFNQAQTGADNGSVYLRTDGYRNPTQRLYSCIGAGAPGAQTWTNDITPYASPSRLNIYGHMANTAGFAAASTGNTPNDWLMHEVLAGQMHIDEEDLRSNQVSAAKLIVGGFATGGQSTVVQWMRKTQSRGAPYVAKDGVTVLNFGLYDCANITAAQGSTVMTHVNGSGSTSLNGGIVNTLRSLICRARASVIYEVPAAAAGVWTTLTMGAPAALDDASGASRPGASDGTIRQMSTVTTHTFTFTIPSDVTNGSELDFDFVGVSGTFGGTITWTGTAATTGALFTSGITTQITNVVDPGVDRGRFVKRFTGLNASHAGQTVIGTLSQVDASGAVNLDCAYITGPRPSMVIVMGQPRALNAAAYTALGTATVASSYWAGNSGATGDTDIAALNTSIKALTTQFGAEVAYCDVDNGILKQAAYYGTTGYDLNEDGHMVVASLVARSVADAMSSIDPRQTVMDRHDKRSNAVVEWTMPDNSTAGTLVVGTGTKRWYSDDHYIITSVRVGIDTVPTGAAVIVDLLAGIGNGAASTVWPTNTGNRPTVAIGSNNAVSTAPPDLLYIAPGDYVVPRIAQIGSTVAGSNALITMYAKKISPP